MPRKEEQLKEIRQKRKAEITETALQLFAERGYHNTSVSNIAKAAGVSKGLMYNYFINKEALLNEILFGAYDDKQVASKSIEMNELPAKQRLQLIIEGTFVMVTTRLEHWKLMMSLSLQDEISEKIKQNFTLQRKHSMEKLIELFKELGAQKPELEAFYLGSSLTGIMLQYIHLRGDYPLEEMKQYLFEKFCK